MYILLERLMLKMKLQYFWTPDAKHWLIGKDPDTGKYWRREKGTAEDEIDSITDSMNMNLSQLWKTVDPGELQSMGL